MPVHADDPARPDTRLPRVVLIDQSDARRALISDALRTHAAATDIDFADGKDLPLTTDVDVAICAAGRTRDTRLDTLHNLLTVHPTTPTVFLAPPEDPGAADAALRLGSSDALLCAPGYLEQLPLRVTAAWLRSQRESEVARRIAGLARSVEVIERDNAELKTLVARFQSLATTDPLTGLPNRRALDTRLNEMLSLADRTNADLSVLVIDLDGFKLVNDTLGHEIGDELLRAVAVVLRQVLRRSDIPARMGGDEFVVIMPHTQAHRAQAVAKRLQEQFARFAAPLQESLNKARSQRGVITIVRAGRSDAELESPIGMTVGIASRSEFPTTSPSELLELADNAMYRGKRSRRGSIVIAESERTLPAAA